MKNKNVIQNQKMKEVNNINNSKNKKENYYGREIWFNYV